MKKQSQRQVFALLDDEAPVRPGEIEPARRLLRRFAVARAVVVVVVVVVAGWAALMLGLSSMLGALDLGGNDDRCALAAREGAAALDAADADGIVVVEGGHRVDLVARDGCTAGGFTRRSSPSVLHVGRRVPVPSP